MPQKGTWFPFPKMPRKRHEPTEQTRALVRQRRAANAAKKAIAAELGVKLATLNREYADELGEVAEQAREAGDVAKRDLAQKLLDKYEKVIDGEEALEPGVGTLIIFGLKVFCGLKETSVVINKDDADPHEFTDAELRAIVARRARGSRGAAETTGGTGAPERVRSLPPA